MTALETAQIELVLVFLKDLLKREPETDSLTAQNLQSSIRIVNDAFLRKRK